MRPSALASPGGWKMRTVPSGFCSILSPMRLSASGSLRSAGRYSLAMIEGGTFQVGLTVMNFIVALMIGDRQVRLADDDARVPVELVVAVEPQRDSPEC